MSPNKFIDAKSTSDTAADVVILINANSQALRTAANNRIKVVVEGGQEVATPAACSPAAAGVARAATAAP